MLRSSCALLIVLLLAGCMPKLTPYKMDIQQGNVVTQEMMSKLKPGMTPSQVRFILGTPLVVDAFHRDRWDYVYRYSRGGELQEHRRIVVVFQDDKLLRIEGDIVPAKAASGATEGGVKIEKPAPGEPVAGQGGGANTASGATKPEKSGESAKQEKPKEERGFFGRMMERLGF